MGETYFLLKETKREYFDLNKGAWWNLQENLLKDDEKLSKFIFNTVYFSNPNFSATICKILASHIIAWANQDEVRLVNFDLAFDLHDDFDTWQETGNRFEPFRAIYGVK